jgi:hypothetical protein
MRFRNLRGVVALAVVLSAATVQAGIIPWVYDAIFGPVGSQRAFRASYGGPRWGYRLYGSPCGNPCGYPAAGYYRYGMIGCPTACDPCGSGLYGCPTGGCAVNYGPSGAEITPIPDDPPAPKTYDESGTNADGADPNWKPRGSSSTPSRTGTGSGTPPRRAPADTGTEEDDAAAPSGKSASEIRSGPKIELDGKITWRPAARYQRLVEGTTPAPAPVRLTRRIPQGTRELIVPTAPPARLAAARNDAP